MNEILKNESSLKQKKKGENKLMLHLPPLSHTHMLTSNHPKKNNKTKKKKQHIYTGKGKKKKGNKRKSVEQKMGMNLKMKLTLKLKIGTCVRNV